MGLRNNFGVWDLDIFSFFLYCLKYLLDHFEHFLKKTFPIWVVVELGHYSSDKHTLSQIINGLHMNLFFSHFGMWPRGGVLVLSLE